MSEGIASGLHAADCCDQGVAVYSPNDPIAFGAMIGIFRAGARWVPTNMRNPVPVNAALLRTTECKLLFFHPSLSEQAQQLMQEVPSLQHAVCLADLPVTSDALSLQAFMAYSNKPCPEPLDDPDRIETVFPTGGTTGLSKAAIWTQRVWESSIKAYWTCLPSQEPAVHLVAAPMTHAAGVVALMMMSGATTNVILPSADATSILEAIQKHRITHLYLPPTVVYNLLAHPRVRQYDYSSLRCMVLAAAPIAPGKLREAMAVFGPVICQSFGQAEAPMFITFLSTHDLLTPMPGDGSGRWASCGRATLGQRVEIMAEDGRILPVGEPGEIVVRGDLVFPGYFKNPLATAEVSEHGWHHTGDIGRKDGDGFIYIVDRKKDMIVTGGFNVFSAEVEQVVGGHPSVEDCAVVGVPDAKWGEAVKAVVQLKPGHSLDPEELINLVRSTLGSVHAPKSVDFVAQLPRSANGKVLKRDVRQAYWASAERQVG
jgi:acyl-CoA synthetase (AMP-forming)/AMP-acid ligase II